MYPAMRAIFVALMMLLIMGLQGCLSETLDVYADHIAVQYIEEHGPIEDYGARCDVEVLDVPYAPHESGQDQLTLDIYYNEHEGLQPIVVNIHGGGWFTGDKGALNQVFRAKYLANQGYVVFNINYRLAPEYPIQTQIEDVMGAVIWAKEHALNYGGDSEKVGVTGGSAGGHLAAMVAWASDDAHFVPTGHASSRFDSNVLAAAPFYGAFDLEETLPRMAFGPLIAAVLGRPALEAILPPMRLGFRFFTGLRRGTELDALMLHISAKYHADKESVPTLFLCGDQDGLYPQSVAFEQWLRDAGVETALYTARDGAHGFDAAYADESAQQANAEMLAWFDQFLKAGT